MRKRKDRGSGDSDVGDTVHNKTCRKRGPSEDTVNVSEVLNQANNVSFDASGINHDSKSLNYSELLNDNVFKCLDQDLDTDGMASGNQQADQSSQPTNEDIRTCLKGIETRLSNMDRRLDALEELKERVAGFDRDLKKIWSIMEEKTSASGQRLNTLEEKVESGDFLLGTMQEKVTILEKEKSALKEEVTYLQAQSMRNNVVFTNIPEKERERNDETEVKLREVFVEKMQVAEDLARKTVFERVHRMGPKNQAGNRKIVAKFHEYKEKEFIKRQGKALKGSGCYVNEQFPIDVVEKRRKLIPKMRTARQEGKNAWISNETLYIDGRAVRD